MLDYVVDVQGFKTSSNKFVFKKVAVLAVQKDALPLVYHFAPPISWGSLPPEYRSINRWLQYNYHGVSWSSGNILYKKLPQALEESLAGARKIHVKGVEKQKWLEEILPNK